MMNNLAAFWHVTIPQWIAWKLPKKVLRFAAIRATAMASTNKCAHKFIDEITPFDIWEACD